MLKADFHSHTIYSYDCCTTVEQLIRRCQKVGITCLAVTDHNEIDGAFRVRDKAPFKVIVGEEIFSAGGEIIGLFLTRKIQPGLPFRATMEEIKNQGGLVYLPHPVSGIRKSKLSMEDVRTNADLIDIVELHNSRTIVRGEEEMEWVRRFIHEKEKVIAAASDAHSIWEFGNVFVEMEDFETKEEFLKSLSKAHIKFKKSDYWIRVLMNHKVRKLIRQVRLHAS